MRNILGYSEHSRVSSSTRASTRFGAGSGLLNPSFLATIVPTTFSQLKWPMTSSPPVNMTEKPSSWMPFLLSFFNVPLQKKAKVLLTVSAMKVMRGGTGVP